MLLDFLVSFYAISMVILVSAVLGLCLMGVLLLMDLIFKTRFGRRFCRWVFCVKD